MNAIAGAQVAIERLAAHPALGPLRQVLFGCQSDAVAHRDESASACGADWAGRVLRVWRWRVGAGSCGEVAVCRRC